MAQTPSQQIPQHVSALLSHLTSRPGVQSTLILSRKDGSIIQSTGLLASNSNSSNNPRGNGVEPSSTTTPDSTTTSHERTNSSSSSTTTPQQQPYKPSQGEALAAHIHAFVSSASALSHSLSHPPSSSTVENGGGYGGISNGSVEDGIGGSNSSKNADDAEHDEREEDDEVKLLRLRTKKHEIVVVPDRKYLLCVVHDSSEGASSRSG